jgi:exodeoxyribonuclease V beta subunit
LHEVLEHLAFDTIVETPTFDLWRMREDVRRLFVSTMGHHGISQRFLAGTQRLIFRTLTTDMHLGSTVLTGGLATCKRDLRELEFTYPIPEEAHLNLPPGAALEVDRGFVRGFIDYIFEHEGRTYLVDWKSDTLGDYGIDAMKAHVDSEYRLQLEVYSLALARMLGVTSAAQHEKRFGGVLYVFLRGVGAGSGIYFERPDFEAIRRFEHNLVAFEYH